MSIECLFFELLQIAIGNKDTLSVTPTMEQWTELFVLSKKHALVGVTFRGLTKLNTKTQGDPPHICDQLPKKTYQQWLGITAKIAQRNNEAFAVCRTLTKVYKKDGFDSCVMKGQSNRLFYPADLTDCRTSGDVDIWVCPVDKVKHPVATVMNYFKAKKDVVSLCYLHIENNPINGVPLEAHLRPSFFNEPLRNRRFLHWMRWEDCVEWSDEMGFNVLKTEYNLVFQMNHMYRHLLDEGIGLRQVLDYYFLLERFTRDGLLTMRKDEIMKQVKCFGMERFAGALSWVLMTAFAMPEDELLCAANAKEGRFLLEEIMLAGNFGHHDPRMQMLEFNQGKTSCQIKRAIRRFKRNMHFICSYPLEVFWEPIARVIHFWWRKFELWRF